MLARPANLSAKQASHYYEKDDYYSKDKHSQFSSYWCGKGSEELGLSGKINADDFQQLLGGYSPQGKRLHAKPIEADNHRAATDYTLNAPKSISVAALVQGDQRLIEAHDRAVQTTLEILESRYTQARVWNSETKQQDKVFTGNLAIAIYRHETNRNQDPHLHSHCVAINATQDGWQWKAVSNELAVQNQKLLGQIYQNDLAYQVRQFGYEIEPRSHGQFELRNYSSETLKAFSSRRQEIESQIARSGEVESVRNLQRAALQTRTRKTVISQDEKRDRWSAMIEQKQLELPLVPKSLEIDQSSAEVFIHQNIEQLIEQEGAFRRELLEQAILENSLGKWRFEQIETAIAQSPELVDYGNKLTTRDQLERFIQLEQLLGLNYAQDEIRQTEKTRRDVQFDSDRDSGRAIGICVSERLAATLRSSSCIGRDTEQIDRCLSRIGKSKPAAGIDVESVARGIAAIAEEKAIEYVGDKITAALESVSRDLTEFEGIRQRLDGLIEQYRNQVVQENENRPEPRSVEWSRAEFILSYSESRLRHSDQIQIDNDLFWAEHNLDSNEVIVGRKVDSQVIARGKLSERDEWDISTAKVELSDWVEFLRRQQRQQSQKTQTSNQTQRKQLGGSGPER